MAGCLVGINREVDRRQRGAQEGPVSSQFAEFQKRNVITEFSDRCLRDLGCKRVPYILFLGNGSVGCDEPFMCLIRLSKMLGSPAGEV